LAGDQVAVDDVAGVADHGDITAGLQGVFECVVGGHFARPRPVPYEAARSGGNPTANSNRSRRLV
jgi:hypothetical protein